MDTIIGILLSGIKYEDCTIGLMFVTVGCMFINLGLTSRTYSQSRSMHIVAMGFCAAGVIYCLAVAVNHFVPMIP